MNDYPSNAPFGAMKPHRGTMLLIFGVLGLVCCLVFGILAWVMGSGDLQEMAEGRMDPSGEGLTKAAKILGMISCALTMLAVVGWVALFALGMAGGALAR